MKAQLLALARRSVGLLGGRWGLLLWLLQHARLDGASSMRRRRLLYNSSAIEGPTQSVVHLLARLPPFVPSLPPSVSRQDAARPCFTGSCAAPAPSAPEWQQDPQPSRDNSSQQPPTAAPWRNNPGIWRHPAAAITGPGLDNLAVTQIPL
eukprot:CAMPEP_0172209572 /NCGR_PEP_ID=MMETSP1050-20130122/35207_1 /TAXON_ID=233186 /ORGANISM="Cryptomonas curvata, Strain CCAP979/52" /LENGTH=149 /DNA_ID=CAMNT_0012889499 /DNA_START=98 /DNA_END=547 /DNA_ORIENTATION=+